METTRRLTQTQKRYIEHVMDFVSDITTFESFGVEGQIALQYMGNDYNQISELATTVNAYIKLLKLEKEAN
jgi:hypothetical protein